MTKKAKSFTIEEDVLQKLTEEADNRKVSYSSIVEESLKAYFNICDNSETSTLSEQMRKEIKQLIREEIAALKLDIDKELDESKLNLPW